MALACAITVGVAAVAPTALADELGDAQARLAQLEVRVSQLEEDYNQIQAQVQAARTRAHAIEADVALQRARVAGLQAQVGTAALVRFQQRNIDPTLRVFTSGNPDALLTAWSVADAVQSNADSLLAEYQLELNNLTDLENEQRLVLQTLTTRQTQAADLKSQAEIDLAEMNRLVAMLTFKKLASESGWDSRDLDVKNLKLEGLDERVAEAVRYAAAQTGKRYVWATAGPHTFDCSGLMLAAYAKAGVGLPHYSGAQAQKGIEVPRLTDMEPGDLIFFYSPIHHVGMYIGHGLFVHARNPQVGVVVQSVASYAAPITAVRRIIAKPAKGAKG